MGNTGFPSNVQSQLKTAPRDFACHVADPRQKTFLARGH
jgi:hypothetical protein